jgi:hypothetical protein
MGKAFWEDEQDLTDAEQGRIKPDEEFSAENPDGSAESIRSASEIEFDEPLDSAIKDRAEEIQEIDNDPRIPDRYEDDVYVSKRRAERALKASARRGFGAAQSSRGVESTVRWGLARVDDFAKTVKSGAPDDAEFTSDNDLLPFGHPLRSVEEPPEGVDEQPFVEGKPADSRKDELQPLFEEKL